jgi:hypothetical protein
LITAAIVSALLFSVPFSDYIYENTRDSRIANRLSVYTEEIENALRADFRQSRRANAQSNTVKPESNERVELPFKVENYRPRPDLEAEMLELVNRERAANGLRTARSRPGNDRSRPPAFGRYVHARLFFAQHAGKQNAVRPNARIDVRFRTAGENLALAPTLQIAHTGLMNSPGHRANILEPKFGRLGIGVLDGGRRGLMITQNFRN